MRQKRRWGLAAADMLAIALALALAEFLGDFDDKTLSLGILMVPIWILIAKLYGLFDFDDRRLKHSWTDEIPQLIATTSTSVITWILITLLLTSDSSLTELNIISLFIAMLTGSLVFRSVIRFLYRKYAPAENLLLFGSSDKVEMVARRLNCFLIEQNPIHLVGYVDESREFPRLAKDRKTETPDNHWPQCLGHADDVSEIITRFEIDRVLLIPESSSETDFGSLLNSLNDHQVNVGLVGLRSQEIGPTAELTRIADIPIIDLHRAGRPRSTMAIKRGMDIILAVILIFLLGPVILLFAVLVKLTSSGPAFFLQRRVGKDGKPFTMIKLRSMTQDAEDELSSLIDIDSLDEPVFKIENDPRVTKIGSFMRRSSIDELPQLVNVLLGSMSLVGPRPEEQAVVARYNQQQRVRLKVKPGLTGPMQVNGRGSLSLEERLILERDYIENISIAEDLRILIETPATVFKGEGAS